MGVIFFDGKSSADYGIRVAEAPGYLIPQKDYTFSHINGRIGDILYDHNSWQNVEKKYKISSGEYGTNRALEFASNISNWLTTSSGYCRLEDSYEPDYYRMAMYTGGSEFENIYGQAVTGEITFNCKPQRYFKSGDDIIESDSSFITNWDDTDNNAMHFKCILNNPSYHASKPIIRIYSNNIKYTEVLHIRIYVDEEEYLYINMGKNYNVNLDVIIDCENKTIYGKNVLGTGKDLNLLPYTVMEETSGKINPYLFPKIQNGIHIIEGYVSEGTKTYDKEEYVYMMEVTPKWWTL